MPEHENDPGCGCWGCLSAVADYPIHCGVHAEESVWVPADSKSNLCTDCREDLHRDLLAIESNWDEVMDALARGRGGGSSERMGSTEVHAPLPINAKASDAMRLARDAVWSGAHQLVMDRDHLRFPDDQSTPALAGWLARWHLEHLVSHPRGSWTVEWYAEMQQAAEAIREASMDGTPAEVPIPQSCKTRVVWTIPLVLPPLPCGGGLVAVERANGVKSVKCLMDSSHSIPWDVWSQMLRASKPRKARVRGLK